MADPLSLTGAPARDDFAPVQAAIFGRLNADALFADVAVIQETSGTAETESAEALGDAGKLAKGGKVGACVIVMAASRTPASPNVPGPVFAGEIIVRALEVPKVNNAERGTKKSAGRLGQYIEQLFHLWRFGNVLFTVKSGQPYADDQGAIGRDVTLAFELGLTPLPKVVTPRPTFAAGLLALASPTPGATTRYTADGAFPGPDAPAYAAPFAPPAGATVRAVAYAAGMAASDLAEWRPAP